MLYTPIKSILLDPRRFPSHAPVCSKQVWSDMYKASVSNNLLDDLLLLRK
jgi:hypothetical protein